MQRKEGFIQQNKILNVSSFIGSLPELYEKLKNNPNTEIIHYEPFERIRLVFKFRYNGDVYNQKLVI